MLDKLCKSILDWKQGTTPTTIGTAPRMISRASRFCTRLLPVTETSRDDSMSAEADIFSDARFYAKMFVVHTCLLLVFCFCGDCILPEIRMNFFSFFCCT